MERKKWTSQTEITDSLLKVREKKKWQLALRRYVVERNISTSYAYYFGLTIEQFRQWIALQFTEDLNWENFGVNWQFSHIIPVAYFDFSIEEDLILCWNFINIRIEKIETTADESGKIDILAAKPYFEALYKKTNFPICLKMIDKIHSLEKPNITSETEIEGFIRSNKEDLITMSSLSKDEFNSLNTGTSLSDILLEREILKKFG